MKSLNQSMPEKETSTRQMKRQTEKLVNSSFLICINCNKTQNISRWLKRSIKVAPHKNKYLLEYYPDKYAHNEDHGKDEEKTNWYDRTTPLCSGKPTNKQSLYRFNSFKYWPVYLINWHFICKIFYKAVLFLGSRKRNSYGLPTCIWRCSLHLIHWTIHLNCWHWMEWILSRHVDR